MVVTSGLSASGCCRARLSLGGEADAGSALALVEDDVLALEEDIAPDGEAERGISCLETTEAGWIEC